MKRFCAQYIFIGILFLYTTVSFPGVSFADTGAGFFLRTNKTNFAVGDSVTVDVMVQSSATAINAVSGSVVVPDSIVVDSVSTTGSILAFWTKTPSGKKVIPFEGVIIGAPFVGKKGLLFHIVGHAKRAGNAEFRFDNGSALTGDGSATNILTSMQPLSLSFAPPVAGASDSGLATKDQSVPSQVALSPFIQNPTIPYINSYTPLINQSAAIILAGKGAPGATTQVDFLNVSENTPGQKVINRFTKDRVLPTTERVTNGADGTFSVVTASNLIAGSYMAVPSLITPKNEIIPGTSILVMVRDNFIIRALILVVNALMIIVPIVGLICLIVYIPWYVRKRMHLAEKRFELTEEKIDAEEKSIHAGTHTK